MRIRAVLVFAPLVGVLMFAAPAGASTDAAPVSVSDASPVTGSTIAVSSSGWRAGEVVSISLGASEVLISRVTVDPTGAVHARVTIPYSATPESTVLALGGSAVSGAPQQVVTLLQVHRSGPAPTPIRPWGVALVLALIAAVLLLNSTMSLTPARRLAT